MTSGIMVSVVGLVKRYGTHTAVDAINFEVYRGEVFGLLGPNGACKTTSLECLEGIRQFDAGFVSVAGYDPRRDTKRLRNVWVHSCSRPHCLKLGLFMKRWI